MQNIQFVVVIFVPIAYQRWMPQGNNSLPLDPMGISFKHFFEKLLDNLNICSGRGTGQKAPHNEIIIQSYYIFYIDGDIKDILKIKTHP
jgi:hypothetical protein